MTPPLATTPSFPTRPPFATTPPSRPGRAAAVGPAAGWLRVGRSIRALRLRRRLRQADLGALAGVSRSTVSRIERGDLGGVTIASLAGTVAALEATLGLTVRWHGEALDRLLDEGHAALVDVVVRLLSSAGWRVEVEVSFATGGERGSIDVLGSHPATGSLLVGEVKSVVPDAQATIFALDRKSRIAPGLARERGLEAGRVSRILFVGDDKTARRRIARHAALWATAFPVRGREVTAWLRNPVAAPIAGLLFVPWPASAVSWDGIRVRRVRRGSSRRRRSSA